MCSCRLSWAGMQCRGKRGRDYEAVGRESEASGEAGLGLAHTLDCISMLMAGPSSTKLCYSLCA